MSNQLERTLEILQMGLQRIERDMQGNMEELGARMGHLEELYQKNHMDLEVLTERANIPKIVKAQQQLQKHNLQIQLNSSTRSTPTVYKPEGRDQDVPQEILRRIDVLQSQNGELKEQLLQLAQSRSQQIKAGQQRIQHLVQNNVNHQIFDQRLRDLEDEYARRIYQWNLQQEQDIIRKSRILKPENRMPYSTSDKIHHPTNFKSSYQPLQSTQSSDKAYCEPVEAYKLNNIERRITELERSKSSMRQVKSKLNETIRRLNYLENATIDFNRRSPSNSDVEDPHVISRRSSTPTLYKPIGPVSVNVSNSHAFLRR